ncbi:Transferase family [Musa troglodytarum]|uniref:Transferase family n=1 Tax=Musa troglodytarum TaxID=320322 RepID=A0A9E7H374_9LILI|nr:Transferase family [Musa troglodytarum]URE37447.1 Transferase family [Musa troglodytarum]
MAEQIKATKVRVESSKLVKPSYEGDPPSTDVCIPLSVFDKINYKVHGAVIYAFRPPTPPNTDIEKGLVTALSEHREWAGRLHEDARGEPVILLNDAGARFIEASSDDVLDRAVIHEPKFIVAWGLATRGLPVDPLPLHDRGAFFIPRNPPRVEFEHRGVEFTARKASLMAHLWRVVSVARGVDERITSGVRISVNGRARLRPPVPDEYLGNLVLWAFPRVKVGELVNRPLQFAAALIHQETARMDDGYFRSLIDFASLEDVKDEALEGAAEANYRVMSPNLEVHNLARFPFWDLDFGSGKPFMFMPCYVPVEGIMFLVPSPSGDGSMDVYVSLLKHNVASFKQLCHLVRPNL